MDLILAYPAWYLFLCVLLASVGAYLLYYKEQSLSDISHGMLWLLKSLRFISIFLLAFLLLEPLLSYFDIQIKKPVLLLVNDNSKSVLQDADSTSFVSNLQGQFAELKEALDSEFEIIDYEFDELINDGLNYSYTGRSTNLSKALDDMYIQRGASDAGMILLASDGLFNEGRDPYYGDHRIGLPVYSLGLGDTSLKSDLRLIEFRANRIAYLGNEFPLAYAISVENIEAKQIRLSLFEDDKLLKQMNLDLQSANQLLEGEIKIEAKELGLHSFRLKIEEIEGEWSTLNNYSSRSVEVIDSRAKVLIAFQSPHPDIAALKESLNGSDDYEASSLNYKEFLKLSDKTILSNFNLLIIHGIPKDKNLSNRVKSLMDAKLPILFAIRANSDIAMFNDFGTGLKIMNSKLAQSNEVRLAGNKDFYLFKYAIDESWTKNIPPVKSPFGEYEMAKGVEVLFYQKLGDLKTKFPLLLFSSNTEQKRYAVLTAEGIWKWRLYDYRVNGSQEKFNQLISNTVSYLASKEDRNRFRLDYEKRYTQGEDIKIKAEFYNPSFEAVNDALVDFELRGSDSTVYNYQMSAQDGNYILESNSPGAGKYSFEASTSYDDERFVKKAEFVVEEKLLEFSANRADHQWLKRYSAKTGGVYFHQNDFKKLLEELQTSEIKPVSNTKQRFQLLIEFPWLLLLILLPFSLEWFLRRRYGSY